ncbi:putative carbohydrate-binding wsc protein [Eutypa lata UCREL1]|uniref:Putative carbohydrate-binding wsc protein n=1 Tax=Eutypa lata (strain UCR-EL1) TaxID=1287681 RepID=M7SN56_EUTLA|nr:putative carbohydrate-binding wsc protein [Eutypa lata UCREL1]
MHKLLTALSAVLLSLRVASAQCTEVAPAQDPSGQHVCTSDAASDLSFLTYLSLNSAGGRLQNSAIQRLVIVVSGANADAWNYHKDMLDALQAMNDPLINTNSVAVLAPYFPNDNHAGTGFPYNPNGATPDEKYPSPALVWYGTEWSGGANNQYPPRLRSVSAARRLPMGAEPKIGVTTLKEAVPPTPPEKIDMSGSSSFSSGFLPRARIPQGKVAIPSISSPRRTKTESCSCLLQEMPVYSEITSAVTAHEPTTLATHATPPLTTRIPIRLKLVSRW